MNLPAGTIPIFVYGTLKRGGSNQAEMRGHHFVGPARTTPGHALYSLGEYPGLVGEPEGSGVVSGEVWAVAPAGLRRLDAFEGVPEGLYRRAPVSLAPPFADVAAQAYFYLRPLTGRVRMVDGSWPVGATG